MRVLFRVRVSIVVGVAMLALIASSAVAGSAAADRPYVACPQVAGAVPCCGPPIIKQQAVVPCCPVPTVGCCSPIAGASTCCAAVPCAVSLSIAATPDPATDGGKATISGTLTGGTGGAQTVSLWQRLAGETAFSEVARTQTDSSGGFQFVQTVHINAQW